MFDKSHFDNCFQLSLTHKNWSFILFEINICLTKSLTRIMLDIITKHIFFSKNELSCIQNKSFLNCWNNSSRICHLPTKKNPNSFFFCFVCYLQKVIFKLTSKDCWQASNKYIRESFYLPVSSSSRISAYHPK